MPVVYLYTGVLRTLALLASLFDGTGRVQHWFARTWSQLILKTIGIRVHVEGMENVHPSQAAVYAVNHLSAADIPVLYGHLPVQFRILAKKEKFRYPFMVLYLKRSGKIPNVKVDDQATHRRMNRAGDALRKGVPLVIFPEGGRSATGRLQDFMNGAFYVAIRAQAPVVPVAIVGTYDLLPINSFHVMPGDVILAIGEPIPTAGMRLRDMDKLSSQVRHAIAEMYFSRTKRHSSRQCQ